MSSGWDYFDKFDEIIHKYMPRIGEGDNMASQIVTAVNKLVYKWFNDGDVFDNTFYLEGWANDLSCYANWLRKYTNAGFILDRIEACGDEEYEELLKDLANELLDDEWLYAMSHHPKKGTIYDCDGPFKFKYPDDDEEEY